MLERWFCVGAGDAFSGSAVFGESVLCCWPGGVLGALEVLRPHRPASSPVGFFNFSSAFSSFLKSFSRIRQPTGTSSADVSKRDLTDVSQAVDPFDTRKIDIGPVRANAVFRESFTASAVAFAIKLLPEGRSCGSVRAGM
jgi:hypothetical protein